MLIHIHIEKEVTGKDLVGKEYEPLFELKIILTDRR
jgi:hypothetical protein